MYTVLACVAVDEVVIVLIGVHNPRQSQLLEIAQASRAFSLLLDPIQSGHQNRHQHGDNSDYYQKLD